MLVTVLVCVLLTYGGVSLFVAVFAVYPFGAELFRQGNIPKRLLAPTIALGAHSRSRWTRCPALRRSRTSSRRAFFKTTAWAAPVARGHRQRAWVFGLGMVFLQWRRHQARVAGEGYGALLRNEPETPADVRLVHPLAGALATCAGRRGELLALTTLDSTLVWHDPHAATARHERTGADRRGQAQGDLGRRGGVDPGHPARLDHRLPRSPRTGSREGGPKRRSPVPCWRR